MPTSTFHRRAIAGARKGNGDTKPKCYYLFSILCGIASADTNSSPKNLKYSVRECYKGHWRYQSRMLPAVQVSLWDRQCPHQPFTEELQYSSNTAFGGARKGTGDTKTGCYHLFSIHCGIASADTIPSPRNSNTALGRLGGALVIPKRNATTCSGLLST